MGIREKLNESKGLSVGLTIAFLVLAGGIAYLTLMPEHKPQFKSQYYTLDDGANFFLDDLYLAPPFTKDGKQVYGAAVYNYASGSKQMVGYLWRYSDPVKKQIDDAVAQAKKDNKPINTVGLFVSAPIEIKQVGKGGNWVSAQSDEGMKIAGSIKTPDGSAFERDYHAE